MNKLWPLPSGKYIWYEYMSTMIGWENILSCYTKLQQSLMEAQKKNRKKSLSNEKKNSCIHWHLQLAQESKQNQIWYLE